MKSCASLILREPPQQNGSNETTSHPRIAIVLSKSQMFSTPNEYTTGVRFLGRSVSQNAEGVRAGVELGMTVPLPAEHPRAACGRAGRERSVVSEREFTAGAGKALNLGDAAARGAA